MGGDDDARDRRQTLSAPLVSPVVADSRSPESEETRAQQSDGGDDGHGEGASVVATGLNMLNELEGAGILGLPYALRLCGWVSLLCLGTVGIMAGYTGYLLAMCMHDPETGKRVRTSYAAVGAAAFGRGGDILVKVVQMSNLLAVGVVCVCVSLPCGLQGCCLCSALLLWHG
jgi:hypothetical protein